MTTYRVQHQKNYTCIHNDAVRDERLTWQARGIHHWLLSFPNDWRINVEYIESKAPNGEQSVRKALQELEALGYVKRCRHQNPETGKIEWTSDVFELPQQDEEPYPHIPGDGKPGDGDPGTGNPDGGNRGHIISNDPLITDQRSNEKEKEAPLSFSEPTPTPPEPKPQPQDSHLVNPDNPGVSATNQAGRFDKSSAADKFSQQPRWRGVVNPDDRFMQPVPEWKASSKRNDYQVWMLEYVRLVILPKVKVEAMGDGGKHSMGQAVTWLANREMEGELGLGKIEAYLSDAQTWWQKRQQSQQPKTTTPALAVAEPPPEPERSLPPPDFKNLVLGKWTGGKHHAS